MPSKRPILVACLLVLAAAGGCGGSDDEDTAETTAKSPTVTQTEAGTEADSRRTEAKTKADTAAEAQPKQRTTETAVAPSAPSQPPEEEEAGGAGGQEPARSLALLTGRGGRITPRVVRVPAFISVRVELRSADGGMYGLRLNGRTLRAGGALNSASTLLDGLRPGAAVTGRPVGGGSTVRIEATAEPGP